MRPRDDANGTNSLHSSNTILQSETLENNLVLFSINAEDALFTEAVSKKYMWSVTEWKKCFNSTCSV